MLPPYTFFFFNDTATTEIYTLSLHDALPISARARDRGAGHRAPPGRRADDDLRRFGEVPGGGCPPARDRRKGIRLGLVARLGGEGPPATRRARGDRAELRAHSPLEPRRDGHPAAAVPGGPESRNARLERQGNPRPAGARRRGRGKGPPPPGARSGSDAARRHDGAVPGDGADRHAAGAAVLPARRDSRVRLAAAARGGLRSEERRVGKEGRS